MQKIKLFLVMTVLAVTVLSSCKKDDGSVSGQVTYIGEITGISYVAVGATVYLMTSDTEYLETTTTDAEGNYEFYPVIDGTYHIEADITVNLIEYFDFSEDFYIEKDDDITVDLILE